MECPYCQAQNREYVRFCGHCGRQMPSTQGASDSSLQVAATGSGVRSSASSLTVGAPLQGGRYIIKDVLGQGGMGAALLAIDKRLDSKLVVIKELISDNSDPVKLKANEENFKREVITLAHLDHPLIPNVTDNFDENSRFFMVQEYIEGENLEDHIDRVQQPLLERDVLIHAAEILDALDYLSQQTPPIVHRDIKPANIILSSKDKKAHLVDFGIARADEARNARRKQTSALGTPGYAPPEQYQGNADPRSDLYALGATLHHLLTKRDPRSYPPFIYPPVRTLNPQLSPDVEHLLIRALNNDRDQRYQSAAVMKQEVEEILHRRFGISSGSLRGSTPPGGMVSGVYPSIGMNPPTPGGPLSQPTLPTLGTGTYIVPGSAPYAPPVPPVPVAPRRNHLGRNVVLVLLALLLVGGLVGGALALAHVGSSGAQVATTPTVVPTVPAAPTATATPAVVNGIGATKAADGEIIGVSNGSVAFDTDRPDGALKQQAAAALRAGNVAQAQSLWQQAVKLESNDAEALIYLEDQRVLGSGTFYVTLVVATMLTGANVGNIGVGRDDLQGAYIAQKTFNDQGLLNNGEAVVLLIANGGSQNAYAPTVAHQIVQAAQANASIVGVMGWPFSAYVSQTMSIFDAAKIPVVSQTASSDLLTSISPYFFRVCPSNTVQGIAGAKYVEQNLHAHNVIVFKDPLDPYSSSLAKDFTDQFQADGGTVLATEEYTVGQSAGIVAKLQDALAHTNPPPDALYFSGYASDISTLLSNLPTSGPFANLPVMGGDALYELGGYQPSALIAWNRLHFTSFTYPDVWDVLGYSAQKPAFFANYQSTFDPTQAHAATPYGWDRADSDAMLSYDATTTLLMAANDTGKVHLTRSDETQALGQLNGSHSIQGISGQIALGANGDPVNKAIVVLNVSPDGAIQMDKTLGAGQFLLQQ